MTAARIEMPDAVAQALAGERAAARVLRRIRDGDDVAVTPRLRAFMRTLQAALERKDGKP